MKTHITFTIFVSSIYLPVMTSVNKRSGLIKLSKNYCPEKQAQKPQ